MNRLNLLEEIYAGRTRLEAVLEQLQPAQMTSPSLPGGWTVKDLLAHLGWWEQRVVETYQESQSGQEPSRPIGDSEVDAVNARIQADFRPRDLDDVREFERLAFHNLLRLVENTNYEDLFDPQRFAWLQGAPFFEWVLSNSSEHYDEHLPDLRALIPQSGTRDIVQRGTDFLDREGRDIDLALVDFAFHGLPVQGVLEVLARYQNPDGGFAGLEVDIAASVSNPFAAELALRVLGWIDPPRDHPLLLRLLEHLEQTQDEGGSWRFAPEVYEGALAPWFQGWQWPNFNPSGQIAGSLKLLGLGSDRLHTRVQVLFDRQSSPAHMASGEFYDVLPYGLYFQTRWDFPQASLYRWGLTWWLVRQHYMALQEVSGAIDATHFLELASRPDFPIARQLPPQVLTARLDQLIADQQPDGGWPTPYDPRWRSWITGQNLLILKAHGRVAAV